MREVLAATKLLWRAPEREFQYVAIDLMTRSRQQFRPVDLSALLGLVQHKSWWDTVDPLAGIVGHVIRHYPECARNMDAALVSEVMWVRRVAMLHQLGWRNDTDAVRLFLYARQLGSEKDFFIRKASGWALRDYARHQPTAVVQFVRRSDGRLSALSVREALRGMSF